MLTTASSVNNVMGSGASRNSLEGVTEKAEEAVAHKKH